MKTVAGVFRSYVQARDAASTLRRAGFTHNQINLLAPGMPRGAIQSVPASDTEQPGMGGAIGGVLGAALGIAGGLELGIGVTALIPGVGPVLAFGMAAAAIFGTGGAIGGALLGEAAEDKSTEGVPADELFFYEDALRQGDSVVFALADNDVDLDRARNILGEAGAQSLDAARKDWWIGLRDAEAEHYHALGYNFEADQDIYRAGFESALRRDCRGRTIEEQSDCLKWWYPEVWDSDAFHRGYERGLEYWQRHNKEELTETSR